MTKTRRLVGTGFAVAASAALIPLAVVYACTPLAAVQMPSSVTPGSSVQVDVVQIYGDSTVSVSVAGQYLGGGTTPSVGNNDPGTSSLAVQVTIPSLAPGTYYMHASVVHAGATFPANSSFQVTSPGVNGSNTSGNAPQQKTRPGVVAQPNIAGAPSQPAAVQPSQVASMSDVAARALDREAATPPVAGPQPANPQAQAPVLITTNPRTGDPGMSGLAIGAITLAVALPMLVIGFGAVSAYQRRTARATHRKDQ